MADMSLLQAVVCTVRGHNWATVEGDVNGAQRTCQRCGRNQLLDLKEQPSKGHFTDPDAGNWPPGKDPNRP